MNVEKLLKKRFGEVITITPDDTVMQGARLLTMHDIGLLVVAHERCVSGVFSERDLVRAVHIHGKMALEKTIDTVMTKDIQMCSPSDNIQDIMAQMARGRFRHMPVIKHGGLCGMVSTTDILKYLADDLTAEQRALFWSEITWV